MRPWHAELLSDVERARRTVLWDERHRTQYTVAAALLRLVAHLRLNQRTPHA
jgi:hypothetical protein